MVRIDRSTLTQVAELLQQAALVIGPQGRILWREDPAGLLGQPGAATLVDELLVSSPPALLGERLEEALLGAATDPIRVAVRGACPAPSGGARWGPEFLLRLGPATLGPAGPECLAMLETSVAGAAEPPPGAAEPALPAAGPRPPAALGAQILDLMPEGVLVLTPEGSVRTANLQAAGQLGYRSDEFVGRQLVDLLAPAQRRPLLGAILRPDLQPEGGLLLRVLRADGKLATVEFRSQAFVDEDGRQASIGTLRDVSRTVRSRYRERQRHVEEAVATFARGLAAELRAAAAPGTSEGTGPPSDLDAGHSRAPGTMSGPEPAVRELIERLATVGGVGDMEPPEDALVSLNAVIRAALEDLRDDLDPAISLRVTLDPDLPALRGASGPLRSVVTQLCRNAAEAMPLGGYLQLRTDAVVVEDDLLPDAAGARRGRFCQLTVQDDGVGIDAAIRDRIFEPYFSTQDHGRSSGLGLAVVRAVVRAHRGFVSVESQPGRGTRLRLFFPAEVPLAPAALGGAPPARKRRGATVLLVDEGVGVRPSLQPLLDAQGYRVLVAGHGEEACRLLGRHGPQIDMAVLDLAGGAADRHELVTALRAMKPELTVVVITADAPCGQPMGPGVHALSRSAGQTPITDVLRSILDDLDGRP